MINEAMFTSKTNEWATPQAFFDELDKEFNFTLDPCATPQNAKCARYFTKEIDGLSQSWRGEIVFLQSAVWARFVKMGCKGLHGNPIGGNACCYAYPCTDGHFVFSRLHIQKTRSAIYSRAATLQRKQMCRAVSVNGCCNARTK